MIAVIPAAGMATRLRPLTESSPKCLLEVKGMPLLGRALNAVAMVGVEEVVIITGYLAEMIEEYVKKNFSNLKIHIVHNPRYSTTNNIYSLYLARPWAEGKKILLLDSDIIFDKEIIDQLKHCGEPNALALSRHPCGEEEVKVACNHNQMVTEISKTVSLDETVGESIGIELMSARYSSALFPLLEDMIEHHGLDNVFYEMAFERLIPQGYTFKCVDIAPFKATEIDTVEDYLSIKD